MNMSMVMAIPAINIYAWWAFGFVDVFFFFFFFIIIMIIIL